MLRDAIVFITALITTLILAVVGGTALMILSAAICSLIWR